MPPARLPVSIRSVSDGTQTLVWLTRCLALARSAGVADDEQTIQTMSERSITREAPWAQVLETLRRVSRASDFYRRKLDAAGTWRSNRSRLPPTSAASRSRARARSRRRSNRARRSDRCSRCRASASPASASRPGRSTFRAPPTSRPASRRCTRACTTWACARDDVAHVTLSYHIMPGGLRMHRAFETLRLPGDQRRRRQLGAAGAGRQRSRRDGVRRHAVVSRQRSPTSPTQQGRRLHYRVGFSTAEALTPTLRARAARAARHRAVRPLRRSGDRTARRRVPACTTACICTSARCGSSSSIPRAASRSAPAAAASWSSRSSASAPCRSLRYAPGDVFRTLRRAVRRAATRRRASTSSARSAASARSRACSSTRRRFTPRSAPFRSSGNFQIVVDQPARRALRPRDDPHRLRRARRRRSRRADRAND